MLVAAVAVLVAPAAGRACISVHLSVTTPAVGPGGTIHYSISGLEQDASYTVHLGSYALASGVSDGGAIEGVFTMPDLGQSSRTIFVTGTYAHSDIQGSSLPFDPAAQVRYEPIAAPPLPPAPPAAPPPPAPPRTAPPPAQTVRAAVSAARRPVRPVVTAATGEESRPRTFPAQAAAVGRTAPVTPPVAKETARRAHAVPRAAVRARRLPHRHAVGAASVAPKVLLPRELLRLQPSRPATRAGMARGGLDLWPLVFGLGVGALLVAGAAAGWIVLRGGARTRDPDEDYAALTVEAELQEIIAEERAKAGGRVPE